jgi:FAD/FMN-containing dehydrogenase
MLIENEASYRSKARAVAAGLREARGKGLEIGLHKSTSNLFRARNQDSKYKLDVRGFNRVLSVDPERLIADVEGMTTYEQLVDATLRHGLLPTVAPELKTITVGGAVSGLGIESSSFKYGLVHEGVEQMEILTANGAVVECSADQNADLFFGFPNSYGTLGYALRLKVRLVPANCYVRLTHTRCTKTSEMLDRIAQEFEAGVSDFLDGTIFGPDEMYVSTGKLCAEAPEVSNYTRMKIYYRSVQRKQTDYLTARDYIWRWDTDWFWCSKQFGLQNPFLRALGIWALNSRTYQRIMRLSQKLMPASPGTESVIQDVQIPLESSAAFCDFLLTNIGITPIWVCPFKTSDGSYYLCGLKPNHLYINFGFWDIIPAPHGDGYYNRMIEQAVQEFGGTKGLYSISYYDKDTFWSLLDKRRYDDLKRLYDPDLVFSDLYSKCVGQR